MKTNRPMIALCAAAALAFLLQGCGALKYTGLPFVTKEGPLRVGFTPTNPPIIFMKDGKPAGVEADFANEIGRLLGRPVDFVQLGKNDQFPSLVVNQVDLLMTGIVATTNRVPNVAFTLPYSTNGPLVWAARPVDKWMLRDINKHLVIWYTNGTINRVLVRWGLPPSSPTGLPVVPSPASTNASTSPALMQPSGDSKRALR